MRRLRGVFLLLVAVCVLGTGGILAQAAFGAVQVTDEAGLFDDREFQKLTTQAEELEMSSGWDIMVLTVADAQGRSAEQVAEQWVDNNIQSESGVLCLIDMDNRELYLMPVEDANYYLTDQRIKDILDTAYYDVIDEAYYDAVESMLSGIGDALQRGIPDNQYTYDKETGEIIYYKGDTRRLVIWEILLAIAAGVAAGGATIGTIVGKYRLKWGGYQYSCRENGRVKLAVNRDTFVNQVVTHRRIPRQTSGGGSRGNSGRSTVRTSAGGRKIGGSGRKF